MTPAERILVNRVADKSDQYVAERKRGYALKIKIASLRGTLIAAQQKLKLYRVEHSGEYIGGTEYTGLMRQIEEVLTETSK